MSTSIGGFVRGTAGGGGVLASLLNSTVSVTGATGLTNDAFGKLHICTGTSTDYTVTLPAAANNAGKQIGFQMGSSTSLTKLVTLDANASELIDGMTSRIMWSDEVAILSCDGTGWTKIGGKGIPMSASLKMGPNQTFNKTTVTRIAFDAQRTLNGPASMLDVPNSTIYVRRSGLYLIEGFVTYNQNNGGGAHYIWSQVNGVSIFFIVHPNHNIQTSLLGFAPYSCTAGDSVVLYGYYDGTNNISNIIRGDTEIGNAANMLSLQEFCVW